MVGNGRPGYRGCVLALHRCTRFPLLAALFAMTLGVAPSSAALPRQGPSAVVQASGVRTATAIFAKHPPAGSTVLIFVQTAGTISSVVDNGSTPQAFTR